jgi:toxin-antitoxin system PIN domain toxin
MKQGLDTSLLVYAHVPGSPHHQRVRHYLQVRLRDPGEVLVVTPMVLHEFVHVVTDPRRFDPPVAMSEALAVARGYLDRTNVECLAIGEDEFRLALELLARLHLGRKRIADTMLAATLLYHAVTEIATCNPTDFEGFEGLRVIDPRIRR